MASQDMPDMFVTHGWSTLRYNDFCEDLSGEEWVSRLDDAVKAVITGAITDVLYGRYNPTGKLPMSFPYCVGQVPVHYNEYATGRHTIIISKEKVCISIIRIRNFLLQKIFC